MARRPDKPTIPREKHPIRAWLKGTVAGRELLAELTEKYLENKCRACRSPYRRSPKVLVVARRLGHLPGVDVFSEPKVTVRLEELVDTYDDPVIECLGDELLVAQLPKTWKHLPGCRRHNTVFRGLTAERRLEALEMLRTLRELKDWREAAEAARKEG